MSFFRGNVGLHLLTYYYLLKSGREYSIATQGGTAIKCAKNFMWIHSFSATKWNA